MIGNITRGGSFEGLGRYLYATGKHHETHVNPRAIASENVMRDDARAWSPWVADMQWCAQQRPEIESPVWHCSLRVAPEDRTMSDAQWGQIAREHVTAMGLTEQPWVAVRHADDHIHIVACRVDGDGRLWRDSHDKLRNKTSMRAIEARHGLAVVNDDRSTSRLAAVSKNERERGKRLGRDPHRARLRDAMHAAAQAARGRGPDGFETELEARAILHRANTTADGLRVRGYSVSLPDWTTTVVDERTQQPRTEQVWVKASDVDRKLSWARLQPVLGTDRVRYAAAIEAARVMSKGHPSRIQAAEAFPPPRGSVSENGPAVRAAPRPPSRRSERGGPSR